MRLGGGAGARPAYNDRNASDVTINYSITGVAPHGSTVRATYTVPTGKGGYVGGLDNTIRRRTAATGAGLVFTNIRINSAIGLVNHLPDGDSGTVGAVRSRTLHAGRFLEDADTVEILTSDGSTGGTLDYYIVAAITEYDA